MTTLKSTAVEGNALDLDTDGSRAGEIALRIRRRGESIGRIINVDGPALRDALLEAFPLEKPTPSGAADRLADWGKELLAADKPKPSVVPGMVFTYSNTPYVVLPDSAVYNVKTGCTAGGNPKKHIASMLGKGTWTLVFNPCDAKALPNPLGIRVGDRVRKTKDGVTISFEVGHIGDGTGHIFAKGDSPNFPVAYNPKGFTVTSREVPDRLPAGTIVRAKKWNGLHLITDTTAIDLNGGGEDRSDFARLVNDGHLEVIHLPES